MIVNPKIIVEQKIVYPVKTEQIQQNGIDLTLREAAEIIGKGKLSKNHRIIPAYRKIKHIKNHYNFKPNKSYSVIYNEIINIPYNMTALIYQRSTLNRSGCNIFSSIYDSGYKGRGAGTLKTTNPIQIEKGARICQIIFFKSQSASLYKGIYQNENIGDEV